MEGNLIPLPPPHELRWGVEYPNNRAENDFCKVEPQVCSWTMEGGHTDQFHVEVYRIEAGRTVKLAASKCGFSSSTGFTHFSTDLLTLSDQYMESGEYYFTVKAVGDHVIYADSAAVKSPHWNYRCPDCCLKTVTRSLWKWPGIQILDTRGGQFFRDYSIKIYHEEVPGAGIKFYCGAPHVQLQPQGIAAIPVLDRLPPNHRKGTYYFKVRAVSTDVTWCANSEWSPLSEGYPFPG